MIIVKIIGGLGNQMMQYAFAHACAKRLGVPFKLDITAFESYKLWPYGLHNFEITAPIASVEEIAAAKAHGVIVETTFLFDQSLVNQISDGMYLDGYWGDYRYSESVWQELKAIFTLIDPLSPEQQIWAEKLSAPNAVALHVRRGDYVTNPNCFLLPQQYYRDAVTAILSVQPDAVFYCFSDDPDWVDANLEIPAPKVIVRGQSIDNGFIDMILMSKARSRIVANSTFSIWASRLADHGGLTIVPSQFFRKDDPWLLAVYGEVLQPVYPDSWKVISVVADGKFEESHTVFKFNQIAGGLKSGNRLRVGVWGFYEEFYQKNYIFLNKNAPIGHELLKPFNQLFEYGEAHGIDFMTLDLVSDFSTLDAVLFFDMPNLQHPWVKQVMQLSIGKYLCLFECELIKPNNWNKALHEAFTRVFTWHDGWVDHDRYIKINYVTDIFPWVQAAQQLTAPFANEAQTSFLDKKLICNISGNKQVNHPLELYSKRVEVIRWFEHHHPEHFDLYGIGWSASLFPSYRGQVENKLLTLQNYRFALCFENAKELPGYITEKMLDCFKAGVVPVYFGAPNITDWIPADCFVDARLYSNCSDLFAYLVNMSSDQHAHYVENIRKFFISGKAYPFSSDAFVNTITRTLVQDALSDHERSDVTVVVPNYNHGDFVVAAVTSALTQSISVDVIVLDNASTDDSWERLQVFKEHPQVRLVRNRWNIGVQHNWNHSMWLATGRYVSVLSADDLLLPEHLQSAVEALDANPDSSLYYTPCLWVNELNQPLGILNHPGHLDHDYIGGRDEVASLLTFDSYITPSAAVLRRSTLNKIGSLDLLLSGAIDWDLWIRVAELAPDFIFRKQPGVCYRQHSGNDSIRFYASTDPLQDHIRILEGLLQRKLSEPCLRYSKEAFIALLQNRISGYDANQINSLQSRISQIIERLRGGSSVLISVIIPTKNRPGLLANALESLTHQTFKDFEVIIHNDGGCDIGGLLDFYAEKLQVSYIRSAVSGGAAASRNKALKLAKGSIITYLDDDDVYLSTHLQIIGEAFRTCKESFVFTGCEYLVQERREGRLVDISREQPYREMKYSRDTLLCNNFIPTPTWAHKRSLLEKVPGFDESLPILEDWDFLLHASRHTNFLKLDPITVEIRSDRSRSDHTLRSHTDRFVELHERIYSLHPVESPDLQAKRKRFITDLIRKQSGKDPIDYSYENWLTLKSPSELTAQIHAERMMLNWSRQWQFLVVMLVKKGQENLLALTIDSLAKQLYAGWQLIVISDQAIPDQSFTDNNVLGWLTLDTLDDPELLSAAFNGVIQEVKSDWISLLPVGTQLTSTSFLQLGDRLLVNPGACVIYTDHDTWSEDGVKQHPVFKPDFNLDMLRSQDYMGDAIFFRTEQLLACGGFGVYPGAWAYDATLRLLDNFGSQSIAHVPDAVMTFPEFSHSEPLRFAAMKMALEQHLQRNHQEAIVDEGYVPDTFQVQYRHGKQPLVSIIIPNRDKLEFLEPCVESLFRLTDYPNFELIIVDNQSSDPDTLKYYQILQQRFPERMQLVAYNAPFNFSAQCNLGAAMAKGEFLLLLNNDTEIVQASWLSRMMEHALRPEVGIVGCRLLYPEVATLQHAGVILGACYPEGIAHHPYDGFAVDYDAVLNRTKVVQNYSAVTAACLLIGKQQYQAVGGMNAEELAVLFNDVDLCLKVRETNKLVVWTPFVTVVHHGHKSLNANLDPEKHLKNHIRSNNERRYMVHRWLPWLANDPAYHRYLDKIQINSDLDKDFLPKWDDLPSSRPRVMALPLSGGSGEYRVRMPLRALEHAALAESISHSANVQKRLPSVAELARNKPDVLIVQNALSDDYARMLAMYKEFIPDVFRIQMLDDLLSEIPDNSSMKKHFQRNWRDAKSRLRKTLSACDRLIVSTEPLKQFAEDMIADIIVMPNMLERSVWGTLSSRRRVGKKPRVGWVGAQQHAGDLSLIIEVVKATCREVDWVFQGMCPDEIRPYVAEFSTEWLSYDNYPKGVAALNLDLAIAPLEINAFNEAKSNLRLLEYGALGWPVICTDIYPYQTNNPPVCRVQNEANAWIEAIRAHIADLDETARKGDQLRQWVHENYMIEDHAQEWLVALTKAQHP